MYKNTQIGYFLIIVIMILIFILGNAFVSTESDGNGRWALAITLLLLLFLFVLFSSLTVKVTGKEVIWYFVPGLWKYNIQLDQIREVSVVRTNLLEGIGIRFTPAKGLIYNVSGFNAVNIIQKNGESIRIGSNEPNKLEEVLRKKADIS